MVDFLKIKLPSGSIRYVTGINQGDISYSIYNVRALDNMKGNRLLVAAILALPKYYGLDITLI